MQMKKLAALVVLLSLSAAPAAWPCCGDSFGPVTIAGDNHENFDCTNVCVPCLKTGSPVYVKTGNYFFEQTDLVLEGRGPAIVVGRTYQSQDPHVGPLGVGWNHSLVLQAIKMRDDQHQYVLIRYPDGSRAYYTKNDTGYSTPLGSYEKLTELPSGKLRVDFPTGEAWTYRADGWIETLSDRNGNTLSFTYSTIGTQTRPTVVEAADGRRVTLSWTSAGRLDSISDQTGRVVAYGYDLGRNLETVRDPDDRYWSFAYVKSDELNLLESVKFQTVTYASVSYDTSDRAISYMEDGQEWTIEYQQDRTIKRDTYGNEWEFSFDSFGVVTSIKDPLDQTVLYEYHPDYLIKTVTEPDGSRWEYGDGGMGRVASLTRRVGQNSWTWTFSYDTSWPFSVSRILGPAGWGGLVFDYDPAGNLFSHHRIRQDGVTEDLIYEYDRNSAGQLTAIVTDDGARTEYSYDTSGRISGIKLPPNNSNAVTPEYAFGHDPAGNVNSVTDPLGGIVTAAYDALGRPTQITLPNPGNGANGFTLSWTYDELVEGKFRSTTTDLNGQITTAYSDVWGNTTKVVEPTGDETAMTWSQGDLVEVVDAEGNVTTQTFDELGRLQRIRHPEGTSTQFTYTPSGLLSTRIDRKNQTTTFSYDGLSRLESRQYPEGAITYEYTGPVVTTVRDATRSGGEKVSTCQYDDAYRLTRVADERGVVEYSWLPGDRMAGYRVDGGPWITYGHYPSGEIASIQREGEPAAAQLTYLLTGERESLVHPNGSRVNYTWDALGRLLTLTNLDPAGSLISRYIYEYDRNWADGQFSKKGFRTSLLEELPSGLEPPETYFFDILGRLARADHPDGSRHEWAYDRVGNRVLETAFPVSGDPVSRVYTHFPNSRGGNSQRLQSDGVNAYSWEANGNLATRTGPDGTAYYTWNSRDLLADLTAPDLQASYEYDFMQKRVGKAVSGVSTIYQYAGWDLVKETTGGSVLEYMYGPEWDEILRVRAGGSDYFFYADALGSPRQILDAVGVLQNSYDYSPWGEQTTLTAGLPNSISFTGRQTAEDGLLYYRFRNYQPSTGRFISADPIGFASGDMNLYRYVLDQPVSHRDPTGLILETPWDAMNLGLGLSMLAMDLAEGNYGSAALDAVGVLIDAGLTAVPGLPAGASMIIKASRGAKRAVSAGAKLGSAANKAKRCKHLHHIVAKGAKRAKQARDKLKSLGMDLKNDVRNLVELPKEFHQRLHTNKYYDAINKASENWNTLDEAVTGLKEIGLRLQKEAGLL